MTDPGRLHVTPNRDLREHVLELLCPCMPREVGDVIIHNAYDRRETGEVCRLALDLLGSALADHGHTWTPQEREAFEHAQHILAIHWPAKDSELRRG